MKISILHKNWPIDRFLFLNKEERFLFIFSSFKSSNSYPPKNKCSKLPCNLLSDFTENFKPLNNSFKWYSSAHLLIFKNYVLSIIYFVFNSFKINSLKVFLTSVSLSKKNFIISFLHAETKFFCSDI